MPWHSATYASRPCARPVSIATRTGDDGTTALMYARRVSKTHPRIEACGSIDELNAALGMVRGHASHPWLRERVAAVQDQLVHLMGEVATEVDDRERLAADGHVRVDAGFVEPLDALVTDLEGRGPALRDWARPGGSPTAAALDMARVVCRRAERQLCLLIESREETNRELQRYLNRLSDCLWLLARWEESGHPDGVGQPADREKSSRM